MAFVKFIGKSDAAKYKDNDSFRDLICYITNPEKATSVGLFNLSSLKTAAEEMQFVSAQARRSTGKKLCHIVITFDPKELRLHSPAIVDDIAKRSAAYFADRYQTVYGVHQYPHRHIHIVFNRVSHIDFNRYQDRYEDREQFWAVLYRLLGNYNIRLWKS